jgi:hypothetical protein
VELRFSFASAQTPQRTCLGSHNTTGAGCLRPALLCAWTGLGSRGVDTGDICEVRTPATCAPISSRSPDRGRFFGSWRQPR